MAVLVHVVHGVAAAWMFIGSWVASCPSCGANPVRPYQPFVDCEGCGVRLEVTWPAEPMVRAVARLLMMRPEVASRNWLPDESLHQLIFENAAHGIFDAVTGEIGTSLLTVADDHIRRDTLPAHIPPALPASRPLLALPPHLPKAVTDR